MLFSCSRSCHCSLQHILLNQCYRGVRPDSLYPGKSLITFHMNSLTSVHLICFLDQVSHLPFHHDFPSHTLSWEAGLSMRAPTPTGFWYCVTTGETCWRIREVEVVGFRECIPSWWGGFRLTVSLERGLCFFPRQPAQCKMFLSEFQ